MFDIGFLELLVIAVVGLLVVGPERLPKVASTLGRWVARARRYVSNVKNDIDRELRQEQIREALGRDADLSEIKKIINDTKYTIEDEVIEAKRDYVVAARDDEPRTDEVALTQDQLLSEQQDDLDGNEFGLTDHYDDSEELDREYEKTQKKSQAKRKNGRPKDKSNG